MRKIWVLLLFVTLLVPGCTRVLVLPETQSQFIIACYYGHVYMVTGYHLGPVYEYRDDLGFSVPKRCEE